MTYFVTHLSGSSGGELPTERFGELLDELVNASDEHPDVSVSHESGWTLGLYGNGLVVWEDVEAADDDLAPRHVRGLERAQVLELMVLCAQGRTAEVGARHDWRDGYS